MTSRSIRGALVALPSIAALVLGTNAATAQVQPSATLEVSKTVIAEGETITVSNSDNDASRCENGFVVLNTAGAPISYLYQMIIITPDSAGDWSQEWTAPIASEWPSAYVGGPFTFEATCEEDIPVETATPTALAPFAYDPLTVSIAQVETTTTTTPPTTPPTTGAPAVAAETAPAFTG